MICDLCGKNEATVHLTEVIDEESRELHLCEPCAREKSEKTLHPFGLADLLAGLADLTLKAGEAKVAPKAACSQCGMTYEDFRKFGRLGCGDCYEAFERFLAPLLKRIHGSTRHVGRTPAVAAAPVPKEKVKDELTKLKERLKLAVEKEEFELAANLRDRIRALQEKSRKARRS